MAFLRQFFTWWHGQTLGTRFFTWRKGVQVGKDSQGNLYFKEKSGPRRWVIYNGQVEASRVPPEWHGWLHHTIDATPDEQGYESHDWELPHKPNMTGTPDAYRPEGSLLKSGERPKATGDYAAWKPE